MTDHVGLKIKKIRTDLGLTLEEFGKRIGAARSSVSQWESGRNAPNLEKLQKIAEIAGISPSELMGLELEPQVIVINEQVKKQLDEMQKQMEPFKRFLEKSSQETKDKLAAAVNDFETTALKLIQEHGVLIFRENMYHPLVIAFSDMLINPSPEDSKRIKAICEANGLNFPYIMECSILLKNRPHLEQNNK